MRKNSTMFKVYLKTDLVFFFFKVDGKVPAHKLVLAAASPLLKEAMSQSLEETEDLVIFLPDVSTKVMTSILDMIYKGRMTITPQSTWAIRSLVKELMINAEDVSVINTGSKKPLTPVMNIQPTADLEESRSSRKRKRESVGDTPKAPKLAKPDNSASKGKSSKKSKSKKTNAEVSEKLDESSGYHDFEDVETWVCAICQCYDPIITSPIKSHIPETTEWIGCDCNRWYHKYCTKLKTIDDSFSCKELNRECLPL